MTRAVLLLAHTGRSKAAEAARSVALRLQDAGVEVRLLAEEAEQIGLTGVTVCSTGVEAAQGAELVLVLGGDGTILRAAELSRDAGVPLLGVNLGRIGFLAEAESSDLDGTVEHVLARDYAVEERLTVDVTATLDGRMLGSGWALNEASVEKGHRERMLEVVVEVDGRPLSRWGCDGVVAATPTGSTAYAFSAGGPVVWPTVEALLVVPVSAHALFARPMVIAPSSVVAMEVLPSGADAVLSCDGRRSIELPHGSRVEVRRGTIPVPLARTPHPRTFTETLVDKFELDVDGWRGRGRAEH
ncbi:MAG: ATP-NAD/AcoX kinase [Frankiales bacterium]|nr:ATP-NAD/AcoX kinase [Frankiales bacterium]